MNTMNAQDLLKPQNMAARVVDQLSGRCGTVALAGSRGSELLSQCVSPLMAEAFKEGQFDTTAPPKKKILKAKIPGTQMSSSSEYIPVR